MQTLESYRGGPSGTLQQHAELSYAKQYCRYGMEVAMLAGITVR